MPFDPESLPVPDLGLQCLACQYRLTGLMVHRCPECGRPFTLDEHIPPGDWPILSVEGAAARATPEVLAIMRAAQIPIMPMTDMASALYGLSGDFSSVPRLAVARTAYWDAIHLILRHHQGESIDLPPPADDVDWTCAGCGEANPANFEVCWQCDGIRPASL